MPSPTTAVTDPVHLVCSSRYTARIYLCGLLTVLSEIIPQGDIELVTDSTSLHLECIQDPIELESILKNTLRRLPNEETSYSGKGVKNKDPWRRPPKPNRQRTRTFSTASPDSRDEIDESTVALILDPKCASNDAGIPQEARAKIERLEADREDLRTQGVSRCVYIDDNLCTSCRDKMIANLKG